MDLDRSIRIRTTIKDWLGFRSDSCDSNINILLARRIWIHVLHGIGSLIIIGLQKYKDMQLLDQIRYDYRVWNGRCRFETLYMFILICYRNNTNKGLEPIWNVVINNFEYQRKVREANLNTSLGLGPIEPFNWISKCMVRSVWNFQKNNITCSKFILNECIQNIQV